MLIDKAGQCSAVGCTAGESFLKVVIAKEKGGNKSLQALLVTSV